MSKRINQKKINPKVRIQDFDEVVNVFTEEEALLEANRCLNCKVPNCQKKCPVNIEIPKFIEAIKNKDFRKAYNIIKSKNSLSCITGRICPQENQCEGACVFSKVGESINIGGLERFVSDLYQNEIINQDRNFINNQKVAIIGSGPSGLVCASECINYGYDVTVFEALHDLGGVLRYGIPKFRLPRYILNNEIFKLKSLGVKFELNTAIGYTLTFDDLRKSGFKVFFIAIGAGVPYFLNIKNENLQNIYSANEFLTRINLMNAEKFPDFDTPINLGENAIVIGGGNVAIDSARVLIRLGIKNVNIVYRRTKNEMPARKAEIIHAEEEGIKFNFLLEPIEFFGNDGKVEGLICQNMRLIDELDKKNKRKIEKIENSFKKINSDLVIIAIGQSTNYFLPEKEGILLNEKKHIIVNPDTFETNIDGVFAGGDVITGADTVISAMGAGKKAASAIYKYLENRRIYENK